MIGGCLDDLATFSITQSGGVSLLEPLRWSPGMRDTLLLLLFYQLIILSTWATSQHNCSISLVSVHKTQSNLYCRLFS